MITCSPSTRRPLPLLAMALWLVSSPGVSSAAGTWSKVPDTGWATEPVSVATDAAGGLYVSDAGDAGAGIRRRDPQGHWTWIDQRSAAAMAIDHAGNLYVLGSDGPDAQIRERDAEGYWTVIVTSTADYEALATDGAGNLYIGNVVTLRGGSQISVRDIQGDWSEVAVDGNGLGQLRSPLSLTVDGKDRLYVADATRIQRRDAQGIWTVVDKQAATSITVDAAGNLYAIIDGEIQKRDPQGVWSILATVGAELGQVQDPLSVAVDPAGHLYVADTGNSRVLIYTPVSGA
jgi:hypothetical protein